VERKTDTSIRSNHSEDVFYELIESSNNGKLTDEIFPSTITSSSETDHFTLENQQPSTIDYTNSKCSKRQFLHVQCQGKYARCFKIEQPIIQMIKLFKGWNVEFVRN